METATIGILHPKLAVRHKFYINLLFVISPEKTVDYKIIKRKEVDVIRCNSEENRKFIVYCHLNKINGKRYIGITCQKPNDRFRNGNGYKSSPYFYNAICKYGWDNFEHLIVYDDLSEDEAKQKEIELIEQYKTRDNAFGYNMTPGGEGYCGEDNPWFGKYHTEESKRKMSKARKGVPKTDEWKRKISESNKGRQFSDETKRKMSLNHADVSGENNPCYGKKLSKERIDELVKASKTKESIEKMKKNKIWYSGKDNPNAKRVICIETQKIYDTINDAAKDTKCNASKISEVCHGRRNHTHHLHFKLLNKEEKNEQLVQRT